MPSKKTGLYLNPISEEIVNRVMETQSISKLSNAINFIIQEYDKLVKQSPVENTDDVSDVVGEQIKTDLKEWFVIEDK